MPNAVDSIPEQREGCKRPLLSFDYIELIEDEAFQEDAIYHALNEGVISYEQAYALRTGGDL